MGINVQVPHPWNVDKDYDLVIMPMHGLNFILNFKGLVFCKIDYSNYCVIWEILQIRLEHLFLPPCKKIVACKKLKFGFQVGY
jgi:hypothetical protein